MLIKNFKIIKKRNSLTVSFVGGCYRKVKWMKGKHYIFMWEKAKICEPFYNIQQSQWFSLHKTEQCDYNFFDTY